MRGLSVIVCAGVLLAASTAFAQVKVERSPAKVERKIFDPANPPADLPTEVGVEKAFTSFAFTCDTRLSVQEFPKDLGGGRCRMAYVVRKTTMVVGLTVTIWLPNNATAKLKAHEEGHREIAELVYKDAERHARIAADKLDGRRVEGEGPECAQIAHAKLAELNDRTNEIYQERTMATATRIQEIYDDLTDHGVNAKPDQKEAVKLAVAQQADEAKPTKGKPAATRPTTKPVREKL